MEEILAEIRTLSQGCERIVFLSGNFNIIHPGHLRLLNFAADCGDFLVVGVKGDSSPGVLVNAEARLAGVRAVGLVNYACLLPGSAEDFIACLQPYVVVKGQEHEARYNPEQSVLEQYGGKLLFSSGEARFSSLDLLRRELSEINLSTIRKPADFPKRHRFEVASLARWVQRFPDLRVVVIGDLIVDEYITCDPLGMSQEDPTIVVTPITNERFVGGAGIVAGHAKGLGACVTYFGVTGEDYTADFAQQRLQESGVSSCLLTDESRPTTLKQRFQVRGKTLLRVSHLRQHAIGHDLVEKIVDQLIPALEQADLLVFSDFNYGCLPQSLIDEVIARCVQRGIPMVADSQSSSQMGDICRFQGMLLITPTEHEARIAVREAGSGLAVLADEIHRNARAGHVFITMGAEGLLVHSPDGANHDIVDDLLPAFNGSPKDVAGAGDCLLITAALSLVAGASIWESAYLASIAAACQVGRVGNLPLSATEILQELSL